MKVYGQLERAQLENVGALPAAGIKGRKVILTSDNREYVDNGTTWEVQVTPASTDTLTNKTLTGNIATNLVSGAATVTLPTTTGTLATLANAETLSNKTLTAPVINDGAFNVLNATDQGSTPASPSAGTTKVYSKTDGKVYKLTSAGVEQELGAGAGGGSINYISANPDAETGTTGWATYKDAAATTPVDGTGGSPALTFTRTTSGPLRGTGSFLITTTAANLQGEGASYDFTLSTADQAKVMSISFDYNIASGTYVTGDMAVYIYDVTNALVIQPAGYQIQAMGSTLPNKHIATFQTSSNSTSYRLIFHRAVSTASASTIKIDNVQVGPQVVQYGAPVTDWVSYTPTGSWTGGNVTYTGQWRRVGSDMEISANIALTGAPTGGSLTSILIPTGYTIDTSKIAGYGANEIYVGVGTIKAATVGSYPCFTTVSSTTAIRPLASSAAGTYLGADAGVTATVPGTFTSGDYIKLSARIPITGWSSTVQMSNDTDTRVVAGTYRNAGSQAVASTSATVIVIDTTVQETHGMLGSNRITTPVPGWYVFTASVSVSSYTANENLSVILRKNGSGTLYEHYQTSPSTSIILAKVFPPTFMNAGDYVEFLVDSVADASYTVATDSTATYFSVQRLSGPSAIAASETVAASYTTISTAALTNNVESVMKFTTKQVDTHSIFSSGTGGTGLVTIPVSGTYEIYAAALVEGAEIVNAAVTTAIKKNGSTNLALNVSRLWASSVDNTGVFIQGIFSFVAGDTVGVYVTPNNLPTPTLSTAAGYAILTIKRIGN